MISDDLRPISSACPTCPISADLPLGAQVYFESRLEQLLQWCGGETFDGVLVFDEVHKVRWRPRASPLAPAPEPPPIRSPTRADPSVRSARVVAQAKNLVPASGSQKPTATGEAVAALQQRMPNAKLVYVSATGASSVRGLAPMPRLGLWGDGTQFADFKEFERRLGKQGTPALELLALTLKAHGAYLCRQLSFSGAEFETVTCAMDAARDSLYSRAARWWSDVYALGCFQDKATASLYWGGHQRFFKELCMSFKVDDAARLIHQSLADGHTCVVGLTSTSEAAQKRAEEADDLEDFCGLKDGASKVLRAARSAFGKLDHAKGGAPAGAGDSDGGGSGDDEDGAAAGGADAEPPPAAGGDGAGAAERAATLSELEQRLEAMELPSSPLDMLIARLGGPDKVAEMTGRKKQREWLGERWGSRTVPKQDNMREKEAFLSGEVRRAASDWSNRRRELPLHCRHLTRTRALTRASAACRYRSWSRSSPRQPPPASRCTPRAACPRATTGGGACTSPSSCRGRQSRRCSSSAAHTEAHSSRLHTTCCFLPTTRGRSASPRPSPSGCSSSAPSPRAIARRRAAAASTSPSSATSRASGASWLKSVPSARVDSTSTCLPGASQGPGRSDAPRSAACAAWKLAVAPSARLRPPQG